MPADALERVNAQISQLGYNFQLGPDDLDGRPKTLKTADERRYWRVAFDNDGKNIVCVFSVWNEGVKRVVSSAGKLSKDDRKAIREKRAECQSFIAEQQLKIRNECEEEIERFQYTAVDESSPYTSKKQIDVKLIKELGLGFMNKSGTLNIPMRDDDGVIWSIQKISADGTKKYKSGGRAKGLHLEFPGSTKNVYIGEGFATCYAAWEALDRSALVIAAFSCHQLNAAIKYALKNYSNEEITLICDWDGETFQSRGYNPGLKECIDLVYQHDVKMVLPFIWDDQPPIAFNVDLSETWISDFKVARQALESPIDAVQMLTLQRYAKKITDVAPIALDKGFVSKTEIIDHPRPQRCDLNLIKASILKDRKSEGTGAPIATLNNYKILMRAIGATLRYNIISKREEWYLSGVEPSADNHDRVIYAHFEDACARVGLPDAKLSSYLTQLCDENQYNPVKEWVESYVWDGRSRLADLYATVQCEPESENLKRTFIRKWLILAIAAAYQPEGVAAPGMLVFQGPQFIGKTRWLLSLTPPDLKLSKDGVIIDTSKTDTIREAIMFWLVELGELDGTFRRSEQSSLKAWLTKQFDVVRAPYAKAASKYPRRTVFFGSVNEAGFLTDKTGNRRYWVIETSKLNADHGIDMQQLWAEVLTLYRAGETWWPNASEMRAMNESNEQYLEADPIDERLRQRFDWSEWGQDLTATQICERLGLDRITRRETVEVAKFVRKLNRGLRPYDRSHKDGRKLWVGRDKNALSGVSIPGTGSKTPWTPT